MNMTKAQPLSSYNVGLCRRSAKTLKLSGRQGGCVDPDPTVCGTRGIAAQRAAWPSRRDLAVEEAEPGEMAWTEQPPVGDAAETQIGLLMRAGTLARIDLLAVPDHEEIDAFDTDANDVLCRQPIQRTDGNPVFR